MTVRKQRLQLIRDRHRELILVPRERVEQEAFHDDWEDFDCFEDEELMTKLVVSDEDEE